MTFEDFLDMMSVFSETVIEIMHRVFCRREANASHLFQPNNFVQSQATRDVKASYAFRIYDFDNDGYIGKDVCRDVLRFDPSITPSRLLTLWSTMQDLMATISALCGEDGLLHKRILPRTRPGLVRPS